MSLIPVLSFKRVFSFLAEKVLQIVGRCLLASAWWDDDDGRLARSLRGNGLGLNGIDRLVASCRKELVYQWWH